MNRQKIFKKASFYTVGIFLLVNTNIGCTESNIIDRLSKKGVIDTICYPRWLNNDEFYYLHVQYKGKITKLGDATLAFERGDNDIYIYKSSINNLDEKHLIKKITINTTSIEGNIHQSQIGFKISGETNKITFYVVQVDDKNKYTHIPTGYSYYIMDLDGDNMEKIEIDDIRGIEDISPDGKSVVYRTVTGSGKGCLRIRNVGNNEDIKIYVTKEIESDKYINWLSEDKIMVYRDIVGPFVEGEKRKFKYDLVLLNPLDKTLKIIYPEKIPQQMRGAAISPDGKTILLGEVCILKKANDVWEKAGEFNLKYPDISPDGNKAIGVNKNGQLEIINFLEQ